MVPCAGRTVAGAPARRARGAARERKYRPRFRPGASLIRPRSRLIHLVSSLLLMRDNAQNNINAMRTINYLARSRLVVVVHPRAPLSHPTARPLTPDVAVVEGGESRCAGPSRAESTRCARFPQRARARRVSTSITSSRRDDRLDRGDGDTASRRHIGARSNISAGRASHGQRTRTLRRRPSRRP